MVHRAFLCLAVSACLVACFGKTTSLGGSQGNQSSASSSDEDGGDDAGAPSLSTLSGDASVGMPYCQWYSWAPVATDVACEYLLPTPVEGNPDYDPKTWDPHHVRIEMDGKAIGEYVSASARCGSTDGWYNVDSADAQAPTSFMICPASCAHVASTGGFLRLAAESCH